MSKFDLASLDALKSNQDEGMELQIKHPISGDPIGLTLRVSGYESDVVKRLQRKQQNERLHKRSKKVTVEEIERAGREVIVASVLSWQGDADFELDGQPIGECNKEAVEALIRRFPFIGQQIDDFAGDQSNFLSN
ncbi:hypothetical protein ACLNGM_15080 [Aureimonas phyllosphaerae]|uniref:hypothetical protein n=1 Tax=Aureimonas phyllosphaerae TaxID=1166078 RepID=UPI003A5C6279